MPLSLWVERHLSFRAVFSVARHKKVSEVWESFSKSAQTCPEVKVIRKPRAIPTAPESWSRSFRLCQAEPEPPRRNRILWVELAGKIQASFKFGSTSEFKPLAGIPAARRQAAA